MFLLLETTVSYTPVFVKFKEALSSENQILCTGLPDRKMKLRVLLWYLEQRVIFRFG